MPGEGGARVKLNMADIYDIMDGKNRKGKIEDSSANMEV